MGSESWRQPAKRLDREFRAYGGTCMNRTPAGHAYYRFPDGAVHLIPPAVTAAKGRLILAAIRERYGRPDRRENGDPFRRSVERDGAPEIDVDRVTMSKHAGERFALMAKQAQLNPVEVSDALLFPERVLWSSANESWMWVRGRVVVAAVATDDGRTLIKTLLWATEELWEQNPRTDEGPA